MKNQTMSVFSVLSMDEKFLKSSFQWFKFQVVWSYLKRVVTVLVDKGQLKQLLFSIPFLIRIFYILLLP
jgi:hypothetical protein